MKADKNDSAATSGHQQESAAAPAELEQRLAAAWPEEAWRDVHVLLAISGGADSVALIRAMITLKSRCGGAGEVFVAHLNHGLRGVDADVDAAWIELLCQQLGVKCEIARADVAALADQQGDGWEAAARNARYDFLICTAERLGARFVATAHNADDQVETVLHRILRGTGLAGLAGIPKARELSPSVTLVRPLLGVRRAEIVSYLASLGQEFRSDASNDDRRFTRNQLRHDLLPQLREQFNSDADVALARLALQAGEAQQVIETFAENLATDCVEVDYDPASTGEQLAGKVRINCTQLSVEPAIIVREVCKAAWRRANWPLQAMGFDEWQLLADMVAGRGPIVANLPTGIQGRRADSQLVLNVPSLA